MRTLPVVVLIFSLLAVAGCGTDGLESKRVDYKSGTVKVAPLEVPPDLTAPEMSDRYTIPENGEETVAVYSAYTKTADPNKENALPQVDAASNVLPASSMVRLERSGPQRWLVVTERAEKVWPLVKSFWLENGFTILSENPEAGLMETDWLENRAKIPQGKVRNTLGKVFSKVYSSDEKDKYRTRLERSKDGNSTEIYISHQGMEEVQNADQNGFTWRSRGHDPEMEAGMLQLLMVKLGGSAGPATLQPAVEPSSAKPQLQEMEGGGKKIVINEPFDKSWRQVGLAMEQAGIAVGDLDRANGVYFVTLGKAGQPKKSLLERLKFWRTEKNDPAAPSETSRTTRYKVMVQENNAHSEISVLNMEGATDPAAQLITQSLYEQLIK